MGKVLIINGSPKGENSNTIKLTHRFLEGMKETGKDFLFTEFTLSKKNLKPCLGCFACWNNPERKCAINDDMPEMFQTYIDSDIIIWSTPLYYFSMTGVTKQFIERTLPTNSPLMVDEGDGYNHPQIYEKIGKQKHVVISTCGFPEYHNFDLLRENMVKMVGADSENMIFSVMGELLAEGGLTNTVSWYLDGVQEAGREFASEGKISQKTGELLKNPLVPVDSFLEMANINFECQKIDRQNLLGEKWGEGNGEVKPGNLFLRQMRMVFNPRHNTKFSGDIEFEFTDTKENNFFSIKGEKIELIEGKSDKPALKIISTLENWKKISDGEIKGADALGKGIYRIEGSLDILQKMDLLFGGPGKPQSPKNQSSENFGFYGKKFYGIKGDLWMSVQFLPWMISWIFIEKNPLIGSLVPLGISLLILLLKKRVKAVTYFEKMSAFHFLGMSVFSYFFKEQASGWGWYIDNISMAAIWAFSIFGDTALTSEYSRYAEQEDLTGNPLFEKTNDILTLFWAFMFIAQSFLRYGLLSLNIPGISYTVYILIGAAILFTKFFSKWYPNFLARGGIRRAA